MAKNSDVNFNFTGDSSDLRAELGKVGNNLDALSDSVTGMSNDARKGLDGVAASAKKTGKAVDPISGKLKKTGGAASEAANNTRNFSEQLDGMQENAGEASSVMGGLSGALSLVSPEAGAAAQSIGDAAGGFEALARTGTGLVAIIGPIAVAVAALGVAYVKLQGDLDKANEKLETQKERLSDVVTMADKVKEAVLIAGLAEMKLAESRGEATKAQVEAFQANMDEIAIAKRTNDLFGERRELLKKERDALIERRDEIVASKKAFKDEAVSQSALIEINGMMVRTAVVNAQATQAAAETKTEALDNANAAIDRANTKIEILSETETRYTAAQKLTISATNATAEATANATDAAGAQIAVLEQLEAAATASQMAQLSDRDKLIASYHAEIEAMKSTAQEHAANVEIKAALDLAAHERGKQFRQELQAFDEAAALKSSELDDKLTAEKLKNEDEIQKAKREGREANIEGASALAAVSADAFLMISEAVGKGNKKAARRTFAIFKALALADIAIKAQQGFALASSLLPPANVMKYAEVGIGTGMAAAKVSMMKPAFHAGSSMVRAPSGVRELNATLREGEAVSTPLGAEILGRGAIEKANAGIGSGGSAPVVFQYEHRQFSRFIRDSVRMRGPLATETDRNRSTGHRNR